MLLYRLRYWHKYIYDEELNIVWTIGWYLAPIVLVVVRCVFNRLIRLCAFRLLQISQLSRSLEYQIVG